MKKIITILVLITIFTNVSAFGVPTEGNYYEGSGGNILGYGSQFGTGWQRGSPIDLTDVDYKQNWINQNVHSRMGGLAPTVDEYMCDTQGNCLLDYMLDEKINSIDEPFIEKKSKVTKIVVPVTKTVIPPVDYFTQECVNRGYVYLPPLFPFSYKCSEDKIGFYICYKRGNGFYEEPIKYLFSNNKKTTENNLRKGLNCYLDESKQIISTPNNEIEESVDYNINYDNKNIIEYATFNPSSIEKIIISKEINDNNGVFNFTSDFIFKLKNNPPSFLINYELDKNYKNTDTNVTVFFNSNDFNLNEDIYALIFIPKDNINIINEINNFIKTNNSEYISYHEKIIDNKESNLNVKCNCKYKKEEKEDYKIYPLFGVISNNENKQYNLNNLDKSDVDAVNEMCLDTCTNNLKYIFDVNPKFFKYDIGDYELDTKISLEISKMYKLINNQNIDKIKFAPLRNTFNFVINKDNVNKEFVIVFLQKSNEQLNITYSNFYILNNEEIVTKLHCEANRFALTFFCNEYLNPDCKIKSCFNEFVLNFNSIDITGFIYSDNNNHSINENQNVEEIPKDPTSTQDTEEEITPIPKFYTSSKNLGDSCSNANLNLGDWGCVCAMKSGKKNVIVAKCTKSNGLVLYDSVTCTSSTECKNANLLDGKKVTTCYNLPNNLCK